MHPGSQKTADTIAISAAPEDLHNLMAESV